MKCSCPPGFKGDGVKSCEGKDIGSLSILWFYTFEFKLWGNEKSYMHELNCLLLLIKNPYGCTHIKTTVFVEYLFFLGEYFTELYERRLAMHKLLRVLSAAIQAIRKLWIHLDTLLLLLFYKKL